VAADAGPILQQVAVVEEDLVHDRAITQRLRQTAAGPEFQSLWASVVERHEARVLGVARRLLAQPGDAEEIAHETFVELFRALRGGMELDHSLSGWLGCVAARKAMACVRARKAGQLRNAAMCRALAENPVAEAKTRDEEAEVQREARKQLDALPEALRVPAVLYFFAGLKQAEIAAQLGCSQVTVSGRISEALDLLRRAMQRAGHDVLPAVMPALLFRAGAEPEGVVASVLRAKLLNVAVQPAGTLVMAGGAAWVPWLASKTTAMTVLILASMGVLGGLACWYFFQASQVEEKAPLSAGRVLLDWRFERALPEPLDVVVAYKQAAARGVPEALKLAERYGYDLTGVAWAPTAGQPNGAMRLDHYRGVVLPATLADGPFILAFDLKGFDAFGMMQEGPDASAIKPLRSYDVQLQRLEFQNRHKDRNVWSRYEVVALPRDARVEWYELANERPIAFADFEAAAVAGLRPAFCGHALFVDNLSLRMLTPDEADGQWRRLQALLDKTRKP